MEQRDQGLYRKYVVRRTDGRDGTGDKHDGCEYFVLDLTHDPFAAAALRAYAEACQGEYPNLAADLMIAASIIARRNRARAGDAVSPDAETPLP